MFTVISLVLLFYVAYRLYKHLFSAPDIIPIGKYVLITGCGGGFGYELAIELDKQGFNVLAGVKNSHSIESLAQTLSNRAVVFRLDVTRSEDIDAAYDLVSRKTNTLHALVNNDDVAVGGFIDWMTIDLMRHTMEVNFFGQVELIKKMLPLLISRRGSRIVNMTSAAGCISLPSMASYSASKFALESFSDCLRREMSFWGLHVSIIEPGYMKTPIIEQYRNECYDACGNVPDDVKSRWGEKFFDDYIKLMKNDPLISRAESSVKAVNAMRHAVMSSVPHLRYRPGWQASYALLPLSMLPTCMLDYLVTKMTTVDALPAGIAEQIG